MRQAQDLMGRLKATGGPRSWLVGGLYVGPPRHAGKRSAHGVAPDRHCRAGLYPSSPWSRFSWSGCFPRSTRPADSEARDAAKKLLAVCLAGRTPVDWDEVDRLASLPSFGVAEQMADLKAEVERELG